MFDVAPHLLERQVELDALEAAVEQAAAGHGSAALVLGEAGIGKSSLVQSLPGSDRWTRTGAVRGLRGSADATRTRAGARRSPLKQGAARGRFVRVG